MVEVYLLYSSKDHKFVEKLRRDLIKAKFAVKKYKQKALVEQAILVPIFSKNFGELALADFQVVLVSSPQELAVIPITIDDGKVPFLWSQKQCVDFKNRYNRDLQKLILLLGSHETKNTDSISVKTHYKGADVSTETAPSKSETNSIEDKVASNGQTHLLSKRNSIAMGMSVLCVVLAIGVLAWKLHVSSSSLEISLDKKHDRIPRTTVEPVVVNHMDSASQPSFLLPMDSTTLAVSPIIVVPPPDSTELLAKKMDEVKNRIVQGMMDKN